MRYRALACDFDGTLATDDLVPGAVLEALRQVRASGRQLILVTGRELDDLLQVFPDVSLFQMVVAENGALVYRPGDRTAQLLADPPPEAFVAALRARQVGPISVGQVMVSTWHPHGAAVLEVIRELGLELQVILNKDAVMVLPAGVDKGTGLLAALGGLGLSAQSVVGVGDGENDLALLTTCGYGVAVADAVPLLMEHADVVMHGAAGAGVIELVATLIRTDLAGLPPPRHGPQRDVLARERE